MVSPVDTDVGLVEHITTVEAPAQKGTRIGADSITKSQQRRSAVVAERTASVTPHKNNQTHGNQKEMKGGDIKN